MADGFLAPDGSFFPKEDTYHAETARKILGELGSSSEPIQELLRQGYIIFIEFKKPGEEEKLCSDMDFVLAGHKHTVTPEQTEWIRAHAGDMTHKQQYDINKDEEYTFRDIRISQVRMYPWCENCSWKEQRERWCNAQRAEKPEQCLACPFFRSREL